MSSLHPLVKQRNELIEVRSRLNDSLYSIEHLLEANTDALKQLQKECSHIEDWYAEGRHGSDKGTNYYRCKICDFHWNDN